MDERALSCKLITPMFSFGADQSEPEIRPTEIKGLMRYTYRLSCPTMDVAALRQDEAALFGGAAGNTSDDLHASPIRLSISYTKRPQTARRPLLLHEDYLKPDEIDNRSKFNSRKCLEQAQFNITLRLNKTIPTGFEVGIDWYKDLLTLSLLLGGLGKRSRKGRGNVHVTEPAFADINAAMTWICAALNQTAAASSVKIADSVFYYDQAAQKIMPRSSIALPPKRPFISQIKYGPQLEKTAPALEAYLKKLDFACHNQKAPNHNFYQKKCTGFVSRKDGRLASPLIISFVPIGNYYWPIYTFVQAIKQRSDYKQNKSVKQHDASQDKIIYQQFDKDNAYREAFIQELNS